MSARFLSLHEMKEHILWGTVRDPWSWYLSWYSHAMKEARTRKVMAQYGKGSTKFKDVLMGATSRNPCRCPGIVGVIWDTQNSRLSRNTYLEGPGGLFTWAFLHIYGDVVRTFVDTKRLYKGIEKLYSEPVDRVRYPPSNIRAIKIPNKPEEMYDDEMIEAVYKEDRSLIELLGYDGPFSTLKEPVTEV
jgi:hypothetical protein